MESNPDLFSGYITLSDVTSQSPILGFTDTSIELFLLINHLLLIYKCYLYKARIKLLKWIFSQKYLTVLKPLSTFEKSAIYDV